MSEDGDNVNLELPQVWQFIHPHYGTPESDDEEGEEDETQTETANSPDRRPADYVKLSKRAPHLGQLMRFLNEFEDEEELQQLLLEKDPVTQQTLLQWAVLNEHHLLVEYLVKRLQRGAFAFDPDAVEVAVFNRWEEMRAELPLAAQVAERQQRREEDKAARLAQRGSGGADDDDDDDEEDEEPEPMPEELVYDTLEEYHEEWGDRGVGLVKRIGELGLFTGNRRRDGTKHGLGQSLFPNGDCYAGEYRDNQRDGRGVYWWATSGMMYAGEWRKNRRQGRGRMVYPDGGRYTGAWLADAKNGVGRYTYPDGSTYDGAWVNNQKHGYGVYQFTDGSSYCGSFHHNEFVSGEWRMASGTIRYMGNFSRDVPTGPGLFEHRCGVKAGNFLEEGTFYQGRWTPSVLKGSTKATPRLEMVAPQQTQQRVPLEFGSDCNGRGMADLVRVANYEPLVRYVHSLPSVARDPVNGVELRGLEVQSMRYDAHDATKVKEVRVRPMMVDAEGRRLHAIGDDVLILKEPKVRLLVLLQASPSSATSSHPSPVVLLEKRLSFTAPDAAHTQLRLPVAHVHADGALQGPFVQIVGKALRLSLDSKVCMTELVQPLRSNPFNTNAEESVLLYAQHIHPDAMATLETKLQGVSSHNDVVSFVAVPLDQVASLSSDAMTVIAATNVLRRRAEATLPASTVAPQRPPTPLAPVPLPRPELQPLYAAKQARDEDEQEEEAV